MFTYIICCTEFQACLSKKKKFCFFAGYFESCQSEYTEQKRRTKNATKIWRRDLLPNLNTIREFGCRNRGNP